MIEKDYVIRLETDKDEKEVENLVRDSFWNIYRPGCVEHYVIHVLRKDPAFVKELDFVMERDGRIIGQNIFVPRWLLPVGHGELPGQYGNRR